MANELEFTSNLVINFHFFYIRTRLFTYKLITPYKRLEVNKQTYEPRPENTQYGAQHPSRVKSIMGEYNLYSGPM